MPQFTPFFKKKPSNHNDRNRNHNSNRTLNGEEKKIIPSRLIIAPSAGSLMDQHACSSYSATRSV